MSADQGRKQTKLGVIDLEGAAKLVVKRPDPSMQKVSEFFSFIRQRIGRTPRERLVWAVRAVQREPKDMSPGDWDNLRSELAGFVHGKSAGPIGVEAIMWVGEELERPNQDEAKAMLTRMGAIIEAAVKRETVILGHVKGSINLRWNPYQGEWFHSWGIPAESWPDRVAYVLGELIREKGALLKECPAPLPRDEEICGTWFVATRPRMEYCSRACQSRASTRASRDGTETPAAQRRKARKEGR